MDESGDLLRMQYVDTYRVATAVQRLLENPFSNLRMLEGFGAAAQESGLLARPFPKKSSFHAFIQFCTHAFYFDSFDCARALEQAKRRVKHRRLRGEEAVPGFWLCDAFETYNVEHGSFAESLEAADITIKGATKADMDDYYWGLVESGCLEELELRIAEEVFYVTFQNRELLLGFNELAATYLTGTRTDDRFRREGVLKRVHLPKWVEKAVFHRDKGRCCICRTDLTGLVSLEGQRHFDHVVPLARGGINDVSNVQLLCSICNEQKGSGEGTTSSFYEKWY